MKHPSLVYLVICLWCWAPLAELRAIPLSVFLGGSPPASGPTYIFNEDCESSDNPPTGWTNTGTANWNYATSPLSGDQSLFMNSSSSSAYYAIDNASNYTMEFEFKIAALPPTTAQVIATFRNSTGATAAATLRIGTDGKLYITANSADGPATSAAMSTNTKYYVRFIWNNAGTCSVEFNDSGTFDASGTDYTTQTSASVTLGRVYCSYSSSGANNSHYDNIKLY